MSEKLLPCPFCGDFDAECAESAVPNVHGGQKYAVFCNACFCEGPTDDIRERAIAAWNRRELESASQPAVQRCAQCGGAKVDPSPLLTGACDCASQPGGREAVDRIIAWLKANCNAERTREAKQAFAEAHNAALMIRREFRAATGAGNGDGV